MRRPWWCGTRRPSRRASSSICPRSVRARGGAAAAARGVVGPHLPGAGRGGVGAGTRPAGVSPSVLSMVNGTLRPPYPLVLGHEAAGEVLEVGDHVTRAGVGEHVALDWQPP